MNQTHIKFGIVGAGMIAAFHADAIKSIDNAELVGVFDQNADSAQKFSSKYNIKSYSSYEQMLLSDDVDAVCICTPSYLHASQAIAALKHNKHVAVEKPMAFSKKDSDEIIKAQKESGKYISIISQLRFSEDIQRVKQLISENAFGTLSFIDLYMKYWRDEEYFKNSSWRGTKEKDGGGALMNQGIHGVDLLLYIAGDAKLLCSKTKTMFHEIEVEDTAVSMLEFENGALGVIEASTCSYPGFERRIEIMGSHGCAIIEENTITKLIIDGKTVIEAKESNNASGTASRPDAMTYALHARQLQNLVNTILGKEQLLIDACEGKNAVSLIESIYNYSKS